MAEGDSADTGERPRAAAPTRARLPIMLAKSILVLAASAVSAALRPSDDGMPKRGVLLFHCIGAMRAAGAPMTPIVADAFIDLATKRVDGFGVPSTPILSVTDTVIAFGSRAGAGGDRVRGSL